MIVSLAVGLFVQQAIRTTTCPKPVEGMTASLPFAHYVCRQGTYQEAGEVDLDGSTQLDLETPFMQV
jgi:hypothetical protein